MWIKNSNDKPDAMLTLTFASFIVLAFCIVAPMFNGWNIHGFVVDFAKPDNVLVMSLLGAFVPAYVIRRNKKDTIDTTTEVVDSKEEKNV